MVLAGEGLRLLDDLVLRLVVVLVAVGGMQVVMLRVPLLVVEVRVLVEVVVGIGRSQRYRSVLAVSGYGGEWFEGLGFSRVPASETRGEWRILFRPGRRSDLYQLKLAAERSKGPK